MTPERIRVAALQFLIRPAQSFDSFRDQVESLVETAADYDCELVVFSEYFTVQLLTLGNVKRPIREQILDLAAQLPQFQDLMSSLARRFGVYIVPTTRPRKSGACRRHRVDQPPCGEAGGLHRRQRVSGRTFLHPGRHPQFRLTMSSSG